MNKGKQKQKAIELMNELSIYQPYIDGFKERDKVCYFEEFAGFWIGKESGIEAKKKELESLYRCTVYAVTHEFTNFGECFDFLIVTDYPEEWDNLVSGYGNDHNVFAYVWNVDDDWCSEFGTISVHSFGGGIKRIA